MNQPYRLETKDELRDTGENIVEMCELYCCPQYHILYALESISQPDSGKASTRDAHS